MGDGSLWQLIFVSSATNQMTEEALLDILAGSQRRNQKRSITGLLLFANGNIIQIMEGPKEAVEALFDTISHDTRHHVVTKICLRPIEEREFPEYRMGFKRISKETLGQELPGFTTIIEQGGISEEQLNQFSDMVAVFLRTFIMTSKGR